MNRAVILSPPVSALILVSSQRRPFLRYHQAGAHEHGQIGRVSLAVAGEEGRHVGDGGVGAEDIGNGVDEGAFAVGAGAVGEDEHMLTGKAGAAIAAPALEKSLQFAVAVSDAVDEL
jgi:hypothetical protein